VTAQSIILGRNETDRLSRSKIPRISPPGGRECTGKDASINDSGRAANFDPRTEIRRLTSPPCGHPGALPSLALLGAHQNRFQPARQNTALDYCTSLGPRLVLTCSRRVSINKRVARLQLSQHPLCDGRSRKTKSGSSFRCSCLDTCYVEEEKEAHQTSRRCYRNAMSTPVPLGR